MSQSNEVAIPAEPQAPSLVATFASKYGVDPRKMLSTLKATAFKSDKPVTDEQMMALLVVANQYDLNPWTKEIYAFPDKKNGIVPVVGVDGWARIINSNPAFDGMEFIDSEQWVQNAPVHKPCPEWIECVIYRKDRSHPIRVRERFDECYVPPRNGQYGPITGPWQTHTSRFLRHKAMIQCARIAFGFVGIYDPDEADRIMEAIDVTPRQRPDTASQGAKAQLDAFAGSKPEPEATPELTDADFQPIEEEPNDTKPPE